MKTLSKKLKMAMLIAILLSIFTLLFHYRTIQLGAFILGFKTSEKVHKMVINPNPN
jgi:hypothetical protein